MEFADSDIDETDSDELGDLENELYSVLHYNVLSEDIPSSILDKYDIKKTEQNEFYISLKKSKQESFVSEEENKDTSEKEVVIELNDFEPTRNVITISDDGSDSDVILNEPELEVTYVSSPSVLEVSDSSSDMGDDMILNIGDKTTSSSVFPIDDTDEEAVKVKWKEVTSPGAWTNDMRKYYNKPCERLKNFDYEKIREEMKGQGEWHINISDSLPSHRKVKRCTICRQSDHQRKNCPRRFVNCSMCGNSGHNDSNCPSKKCLNCGRKNRVYVPMCQRCESARFQTCSECQQKGHTSDNCPDTWRRYHATTKGELVVREETVSPRLICCNCAQSGHLFENCPKLYWSVYPPTSCLIKKTEELVHKSPKGKRFRGQQEGPTDFVSTPKKRRLNKSYPDSSPNGPSWKRGSFNNKRYSDRNHTHFDQSDTPFDRSPVPFHRNPVPYDQNPSPFGRNPSSINITSTPFNQRSPPFYQRSPPFNQRSPPFNQRSPPFNQRSTPFNQRSTPFNQRSTPFSHKSTPFHERSTPFNRRAGPFDEASTSSKNPKPLTPQRNKKIRYFHNNPLNNSASANKNSPNQTKSPKQKKKKKKKKGIIQ